LSHKALSRSALPQVLLNCRIELQRFGVNGTEVPVGPHVKAIPRLCVVRPVVRVAAFAGFRKGEIRGQWWQDDDDNGDVLGIRRSVWGTPLKSARSPGPSFPNHHSPENPPNQQSTPAILRPVAPSVFGGRLSFGPDAEITEYSSVRVTQPYQCIPLGSRSPSLRLLWQRLV
jgi:hypothetical protein